MAKRQPEALLPGRNARALSRREFAAEVAKRQQDQSNPNNTLLMPDEVGGDYILSRALFTTDGGTPRMITLDDLRNFRARVKQLEATAKKQRFLGGITAKQVINRSWADDRKRCNEQIRTANPTNYRAESDAGGQGASLVVHFYTNASADSEYSHHNVNVQFLNFGAAVASPVKADKIVKQVTGGSLRFECSCPRFKYFFRYVATQARYVHGRTELAFPKIRNPGVSGVACKHALRVMQVIDASPTFRGYMARAIQKFRDDIGHTESVERIADQRELEDRMRKESYRQRKVETTEEKRAKRALQPAEQRRLAERQARQAQAEKNMADKALMAAKAKQAREVQRAQQGARANIEKLLALGAITRQQADAMLATLKG